MSQLSATAVFLNFFDKYLYLAMAGAIVGDVGTVQCSVFDMAVNVKDVTPAPPNRPTPCGVVVYLLNLATAVSACRVESVRRQGFVGCRSVAHGPLVLMTAANPAAAPPVRPPSPPHPCVDIFCCSCGCCQGLQLCVCPQWCACTALPFKSALLLVSRAVCACRVPLWLSLIHI